MSTNAGQLLWNRQMVSIVASVVKDVDTGIAQTNRGLVDPILGVPGTHTSPPAGGTMPASRVMVIPLVPVDQWVGVTHTEPYIDPVTNTVHVQFSCASDALINVWFWDPHTAIGPGAAMSYDGTPLSSPYIPASNQITGGNIAGQLLWSRLHLEILGFGQSGPPVVVEIPTGLTQLNRAWNNSSSDEPDFSTPSRIQVIPLAPLDPWVAGFITHTEPFLDPTSNTIHVLISNANGFEHAINVLFWDPHTVMGPGVADEYAIDA
jgi:hypothetical protein